MPKRRPNFLFLFPDQHRPDWLGVNEDLPLRTPNIDRLCERGVRFTSAMSPSPLCAPARACLASGRDYAHCRVPSNGTNYPLDLPTYYQSLRDAGYRVGGVGKFDLNKPSRDWGLDGQRRLDAWGFTDGMDNEGKYDGSGSYKAAGNKPCGPYMKYLADRGLAETYVAEHERVRENAAAYVTALDEEAYCDNWLSRKGLEVLEDFPADQPWHLAVNFTGPHGPRDVTKRMAERWADVDFPPPYDCENPDAESHQRNRRYYAAMIENIDRWIGEFIDAVERRGELDNTVIVFSSDHGEFLGDHGKWGKSYWYFQTAGIPLIVSAPGGQRGVVSDALVELHDLAPTFLEYAGCDPLPDAEARSIVPLVEGRTETHRNHIVVGLHDWWMIYDGRYKLVMVENEPDRLFDMQEDPLETRDVAAENTDVVDRLRDALAERVPAGAR